MNTARHARNTNKKTSVIIGVSTVPDIRERVKRVAVNMSKAKFRSVALSDVIVDCVVAKLPDLEKEFNQ